MSRLQCYSPKMKEREIRSDGASRSPPDRQLYPKCPEAAAAHCAYGFESRHPQAPRFVPSHCQTSLLLKNRERCDDARIVNVSKYGVMVSADFPKFSPHDVVMAATAAIRALEQADRRQKTPIIALTANMMVEETERCRQAGMDAHVDKPIEWQQLFQTIEQLCNASSHAAA